MRIEFIRLAAICDFLIFSLVSSGQINLSLKLGAGKLFTTEAVNNGYAYRTFAPPSPYPAFHLELSKSRIFKNTNLLSGFSFIPTFSGLGFNENIQSGSSRLLTFIAYSYQLYIIIDRQFWNRSYGINKNYFSINCGIGFWPGGKGMIDSAKSDDYGVTKSGEILTGTEYALRSIHSFELIGLAGGRYHIKNKVGKEVLILELQLNHAINQYFSYDIHYKLNGNDQMDRLPEKGFSLQFLLVTRIASFGKKKSK